MQGGAEEVNAVPARRRLVLHTFLDGVDAAPGRRIWPGLANILSTVGVASKAFISNALVWRHAVGTVVTETAVIHVPAMQERAGGQRGVPGKRRQTAGSAILVDQREKLTGKLLGFGANRGRSPWSVKPTICWRNQCCIIAVRNAA